MGIALGKQVVEINGAVEYSSRKSEDKEQAIGERRIKSTFY